MSSTTFPNGEVLTSTAMTPTQIEAGMQPLVASIFGIDPACGCTYNPKVWIVVVLTGQQTVPALRPHAASWS